MTQNILKLKVIYYISIVLFISIFYITFPGMSQDAQSFYQNGYQYFSQGDYQKAEENYQKALELNSDFEDAHYWLGKVYRETGQYDKAIRQWFEVLRINPRNPYSFRYLNESFRDISRVRNGSASDYYSEGLKMLEINDQAFLNENNYSSQALLLTIPYFKKAIDLQNDLIGAHYWLAEIYQALSKKVSWQYTSMAINSLEKVVEIEGKKNPYAFQRPSEYWYAYQELILIYQSLGLNERKENLLSQLEKVKTDPYQQVLTEAGYSNFGYPDKIEVVKQKGELTELWKYEEEGKTFRVVNKEVVNEELTQSEHSTKENILTEETIEKEIENEDDL